MIFGRDGRNGSVAKNYLFAALFAALLPLILISVLYDRYSAQLIDTISHSRAEGELEAVTSRMGSFLGGHLNRLENIVDLPETARFLGSGQPINEASDLLDFLLLEAESQDVYSIELLDPKGKVLAVVPSSDGFRGDVLPTTPIISFQNAEVVGPVLPADGYPGWFQFSLPVKVDHQILGYAVMRMRLASLTEQMQPLELEGIRTPQLVVFDRMKLKSTGAMATGETILQSSRAILPGWHLELVAQNDQLTSPRQTLRIVLLLLSALLAAVMVLLFLRLSHRLNTYLAPLKAGADAVSRGDFMTAVPETGPGELGSLAKAFNHMRRHLRDMINSRVESERRASLGNLAAGIAHEVRNPLATVVTALYGLKRQETKGDRIEMYDEIAEEIERVDQTIEEFLKYARPARPNVERVAVRDVFRSLHTLTAAKLMEHGVTLNLGGESRLEFEIDEAHLRQILLNLILNSIDALPQGGLISLTALRVGGDVQIRVEDNGTGMTEEVLAKVLRPFFTTRTRGSGLGLAVCAELVRSNGGRMDIESAEGKGTKVTLTFPRSAKRSGADDQDHPDH
ncbi:Sensor protein ZraS [Pelagimonas phthalicica]|uniref:histidine kinase n=1 Tax=Pelagimonas phthalicica TaxID=1037362 RepID=A0A238J968_9RHOB|nr:HAMP domain-containing sensor histidine kinase [Pelagimonas phthalicica]TDS94265.1 two-component system sensor histidine kinase AtoS [Pelagimonas phthalicica]SMX27208.1 Sensor protein ZraS [Pelagimonas phthalicica]